MDTEDRLWVPIQGQGGGVGWAKWVRWGQRYKLVLTGGMSPGDVMYGMVTAGNNALLDIRMSLRQ